MGVRNKHTWTPETRPTPKSPGRKPGGKNRDTKLRELMGKSKFNLLKAYLENEGIDKLITEMGKMKGKDYVNAWYHLAEYIKPKLHRDMTPQDKGDTNIENHIYLSLPLEEQMRMVELHQKALTLSQGVTVELSPQGEAPQALGNAIQDIPYEERGEERGEETPPATPDPEPPPNP